MKKCLSVVLVAVMLLCSNLTIFATNYVINFIIDAPEEVTKGEEFTVSVGVDKMKGHILAGTIGVLFDNDIFEYVSATGIGDEIEEDSDFDLSKHFASFVNDTEPNCVIVAFFSYDKCPEDYVKIVEIKLKAKKTGNTYFAVTTGDWTDGYTNTDYYWDSDKDGTPETKNKLHSVSVIDLASDYCVEYVIDKPDSVVVGEEFNVSVSVDNMKNHIMACTLEFTYDCDMLELVSCKCPGTTNDGSFYNDEEREYMYSLNTLNPGTVIVSFAPFNNCVDDIVELIEFTFVAKHKGEANISVTSDDWEDIYNGKTLWSIESNTPAPEGLETTISVNVAEMPTVPEIVYGDVNGDGKITAADARLTLRASARIDTFTDEQSKAGDVNFDKKITAADARLILRVSAKIDSFDIPVPEPEPEPEPEPAPSLELSETKLIAYVDNHTSFYAYVKNIENYEITAEFVPIEGNYCTADDVEISVTGLASGALIYVDIAELVLHFRTVGVDYFSESFAVEVSLKDDTGKIVDKETAEIEIRYSDEDIKKYGTLKYLTYYVFQTNDEKQCFELLIAFSDSYDKQVKSYGMADISILNHAGETIYNKTHDFKPSDFTTWENENIKMLFACIEIPYADVPKGVSPDGVVNFNIYTPFSIKWEDISLNISCLPLDETLDLDNPEACLDYGHLVNSGLCVRCNSYLSSDISFFFGDENGNLLPAVTTYNLFGQKTSVTITGIKNVSVSKNYRGLYDVTIIAEGDITTPVYSGDEGYFTVCVVDGKTNTTITSGQISYDGYGKADFKITLSNFAPGVYAVMFLSIDIHI
ncbi:MAG: hypothetical protein IJ289_03335 [Clostridia bacterium]|nr:hypothetical protein [Clostridia bacterium]